MSLSTDCAVFFNIVQKEGGRDITYSKNMPTTQRKRKTDTAFAILLSSREERQ